jgi:hypothetical protein
MIKPAPPKTRGIAGLVLLFCVAALIAGVGFDFMIEAGPRVNVIAQPGGRAVLGVGVAAVMVLLAHVMRLALGQRPRANEDGERDAVDHA